jgi:hypothetical protein
MAIYSSILLGMRNVSEKICREKPNTNFMLNNIFPKMVPLMRYRGADKSLARPGRKQGTATEVFGVHISCL